MVKQKFLNSMQWAVIMVEAWTNPEFQAQLEADPTRIIKDFAKARFSVELERVMVLPPPPKELSAEALTGQFRAEGVAAAGFCCCCCTTLVNRPDEERPLTEEPTTLEEPPTQPPLPKDPSIPPKPDTER